MDLQTELEFAGRVALRASSIVMGFYGSRYGVKWKGRGDPVTDADEAATKFISTEIFKSYPEDGFLIEERVDDKTRIVSRRAWIVDPLDGTLEFMDHNGQFSILIGLVSEGRPVLGVIAVPAEGKLYGAVSNYGVFEYRGGGWERLEIGRCNDDISNMKIVVSRSHRSPIIDEVKEFLGIEKEISFGSVGLKILKVILGEANLYFHFGKGIKLWDTCAPEAIAIASGINFTDTFGRLINYNADSVFLNSGVVVCPPAIHSYVIGKLKDFRNRKGGR